MSRNDSARVESTGGILVGNHSGSFNWGSTIGIWLIGGWNLTGTWVVIGFRY
jgi:hypothetical protein